MQDNVNKMYIVYKHVQDSTKSASLKPTVKPTASKALNPDYKLIVHFVHLSFIQVHPQILDREKNKHQ